MRGGALCALRGLQMMASDAGSARAAIARKKVAIFNFIADLGGLGRFWKILVIEANDLGLQKRPFSPFFSTKRRCAAIIG